MRRTLLLLASLVAGVLLFPASAGATVAGSDGLIAFNRTLPDTDGLAQILTADPSGGNVKVLPLPYQVETFSSPVWSPDGSKILISHTLRFLGNGDCCLPFRPLIVNADGSGAKLLTMPWAPPDSGLPGLDARPDADPVRDRRRSPGHLQCPRVGWPGSNSADHQPIR